jgi:hypothetical protein
MAKGRCRLPRLGSIFGLVGVVVVVGELVFTVVASDWVGFWVQLWVADEVTVPLFSRPSAAEIADSGT